MMEQSREAWLRPRLEALNRRARLVPEQAHPVDIVSRCCQLAEMDTPEQRDVATAAARTSIASEIESRWPGAPYVIRQGRAEDYRDLDLQTHGEDLVVLGVVYRFDT